MDKFKLYKKWFWIGIVAATLNPIIGLTYGIALLTEKDHRKEGTIIVAWSIIWTTVSSCLNVWLVKKGYLPTFQVKSPGKLFEILK